MKIPQGPTPPPNPGMGPIGPAQPARPRDLTEAGPGLFHEMIRLLDVKPENALEDLNRLFDFAASRLTPVPGGIPASLDGLEVEEEQVPAEDEGPDWDLAHLGDLSQQSREVDGQIEAVDGHGQLHVWDAPE